jgi:K+/H+ antiporter YhaU regulatory subunit KhtT
MTLADADVRDRHGVSVIAVQGPDGDDTTPNPRSDTLIQAGQTLVLLGPREGYESVKELARRGTE